MAPAVRHDRMTDAVLDASRVLVAVAARSLAAHEHDVSIPQYRALVVLASRGPLRPGELAAALGIDPSAATRMSDRLVRKHLVSRRRPGGDRREVRLRLTDAGQELVEAVTAERRREISRILRLVPADERPEVLRAFEAFGRAAGETPEPASGERSWVL